MDYWRTAGAWRHFFSYGTEGRDCVGAVHAVYNIAIATELLQAWVCTSLAGSIISPMRLVVLMHGRSIRLCVCLGCCLLVGGRARHSSRSMAGLLTERTSYFPNCY